MSAETVGQIMLVCLVAALMVAALTTFVAMITFDDWFVRALGIAAVVFMAWLLVAVALIA